MNKKQTSKKPASVNAKVKDYSNDPYFVKRDEEAKAFLEKHGFPKELLPPDHPDRKKP